MLLHKDKIIYKYIYMSISISREKKVKRKKKKQTYLVLKYQMLVWAWTKSDSVISAKGQTYLKNSFVVYLKIFILFQHY